MFRSLRRLLPLLLLLGWNLPAHAQQSVLPCYRVTGGCTDVSATNPLPVSASVSASITGFAPASTGTPISVTTGGVTGSLPAGAVVVASNVGATNGAYCKLGASATTGDQLIPPNSWFAFTVGASTQLTCITSTSTTTVNMVGGSGLPTGAGGGGGGGSGGGGAVYGPTANGSAAANPPVIIGGTSTGGATGNVANATVIAGSSATTTMPAIVVADPNLLAATIAPIPAQAGSVIIGGVAIDQTTDGTTNAVHLKAGTAIAGKFGIDQTTPGTTNGVQVNAALPAGTNTIGKVGQDFSTSASAPINVSTATTTQLVALSGSTKVYVTSFDVIAGGTGNITFEYGTGSACGTGTTVLTGAYNLTAQAGISKGSGIGPVLVVPAGNALCVLTSAAVQMSGSVSYQQY
jgi:hypothetical protein